jgi:hypothetical protein
MWISWTLLGYLMIVSKRYIKVNFNVSHAIHSLLGTLILVLTLTYAFIALSDIDWTINTVKAHTFFGLFTLAFVLIVASMGILGSILMLYYNDTRWKEGKEIHVLLTSIHKKLARWMLLIGFVTTATGLLQY